MPRYSEKNYSLHTALMNIGDYFWRLYRDDLKAFALNRSRIDIPQRIHAEWDHTMQLSPVGTDIRIEWALAIYDHGDWERSLTMPVPDYRNQNREQVLADPRRRYAAEYRCDNGIYVRSLSELCIANWLYANRIPFEYERAIRFNTTGEQAHCDFYLSDAHVYIEFWGMYNDPSYAKYKQWKEVRYLENNLPLISLYPSDLKNLRDQLENALHRLNCSNI